MGWTGTRHFQSIHQFLRTEGAGGNAKLTGADFSRYARLAPDRPRKAQQVSLRSKIQLELAG